MNKVLDQAIAKICALPDAAQEYAASVLEQIAAAGGDYRLCDDERAAVRDGLADIDAGRIVPDAEMDAFWTRHSK